MKKSAWILLTCAAAAVLAWTAQRFYLGDQARLERLLKRLAQSVTIAPNEGQITRLAKINRAASLLAPDVLIEIANSGAESIATREDLVETLTAAQRLVQQLEVRFLHHEIEVSADGRSATALVVALANLNGEKNAFLQEIKFNFTKSEKRWLILSVKTAKKL